MEAKAEEKRSFEATIKELEDVVGKLESDNLDLDASIVLFLKGIELAGACGKILEEAEGKIVKLIKDTDGGFEEEDFVAE
ncbi:MAG: exodeoxyribonuclease VII small subunit [Oscillospiraceae bacterium]|nr:exodeoxyribonuclease VII small subunit [Oscillospiraceae bacterium]